MAQASRILVVEDDQDMREMLVEALQDEGYAVRGAASGQEALGIANRASIDLLVTDVRMGGMDGLETLAAIKQLHPHIRSIIITGYASDDAPVRAIKLEAWDYLYKPFSLDELLRAVQRVLHAEVEKEKTQKLLGTLTGGLRRLVEAAGAAMVSHQLAALDKERDRAYSSYYVSIRSRNLGLLEALLVWDKLEELERAREAFKAGQSKDKGELTQGYQYVVDLVSAYSRNQMAVYPDRKPGQVGRAQFGEFYKRVQQGQFPSHQLSMGPFLRSLDPLALSGSPELTELYRGMWGEPGSEPG